jgi:hypothetical protein
MKIAATCQRQRATRSNVKVGTFKVLTKSLLAARAHTKEHNFALVS